ncbi:thermonuclease family protein [Novosphingobium sp. NDB2Meth1]|uniref:thermonuclease family protein n=1 Tax=Novosphingobium sp. NDB2Meth1 TaxID=1892847 RepID=UPI0009303DB5|nr:thermonuclease family protein [Novosphingobium sp. NDB2Meth1]
MATQWDEFAKAAPDQATANPWDEFRPVKGKRKAKAAERADPRSQPPPTLTGDAVDGDTLKTTGAENLRLYGVDAPELKQQGLGRDGRPVAIGSDARAALDQAVLPNALAGPVEGYSYGRPVAPVVQDGADVGVGVIRGGNALAAPEYLAKDPGRRFQYMQAERLARQNLLGIHRTQFQDPADYRKNPLPIEQLRPDRETVPLWWTTPTPLSGMRPDAERQYIAMVNDNNVSPKDVQAFARANGFTVADGEVERVRAQSKKTGQPISIAYKDAPKVLTDPGDGALGAGLRGLGSGALANFLEEGGAVVDALGGTPGRENVWNSNRRFADIWANNEIQNESITGFDKAQHPYATTAGEFAGALALPVGKVRSAADLAKWGAAYGGLSGLGTEGTVEQRLGSGAVGAGLGAATSVIGAKLLEAASPLVAKGWRWVRGKSGPELVPPAGSPAAPLTGDDLEQMVAGNRQEGGERWSAGDQPTASQNNLKLNRLPNVKEAAPNIPKAADIAMAGEPGASISQEVRQPDYLFRDRPTAMGAPLSEAQIRVGDIQPRDLVPLPSNEVGSVEEAAAIDKGRFAPATAPNERGELTRQTLRAWNGAEVPKVGPVDLVGWLRMNGGLKDQGGELSHMGLNNKARSGMDFVGQEARLGPLVNNESGMTLDDAAMRAWEAGYFPDHMERPDVNTFLDAMRGTQEGWKRHFLPEDFAEIDRFNAARGERQNLAAQRSEVGQVWRDKSVPADEPQPFAPPEAYEEWPAGGPDYAGNINLDKLDTPQDIRRALSQVNNRVGGFDAATRGRITQAETERLAGELGMTPETLLARRKGQALNAEEALAARQMLAKSGNELVIAAKRVQAMENPGDEVLADFQRKLTRHVAIQEQVSGMTAEAGRALQQFRMLADSRSIRGDVLTAMVNRGGGRKAAIDAAETLLDAVESGPGVFNVLAEKATKPKLRDKLTELWINSLLSGPQTHAVNITSNTLTSLAQVPEFLTAAAIGAPRRAVARFQGRNTEVVTGTEVGARVFGLLQGAKEGLRLFRQSLRTGEPSDLVSKVEGQGMKAISGVKGEIVRIPTRLLTAEDELFKGIARRMELNGEAVRVARREGLRGEAAKRRIAELVEMPTDGMLERSMEYARYLTFQRKLGPAASKISGLTQDAPALKLFLPFVRTPTNLLKFAAERSPAAPLLKEWRADFAAGGARRDIALSRALLGTGVGAAIYELALQGKITGTAPTDPSKARLMYADGFQPYSIRVGDKWYSYKRLDPFSTTLGVAADLALLPEGMSERQRDEQTTLLVASIMGNLANKTWLSGVSDIIGTIEDPERNADRMMQRLAGSLAVPTGVSQVARVIDPTARKTETIGDAVQARIPGASERLLPRRDVWGREVTSEGGVGPDILSPVYTSSAKSDPVNKALIDAGVSVGMPSKSVRGVELTPEQYDRYHAVAGQKSYAAVSELISSDQWNGLDEEGKQDAVTKAVTAARKAAASEVLGDAKGAEPAAPAPSEWDQFSKVE